MSWTHTDLGSVCVDGGIQTGPFGSQLHAHEYTAAGVPVVMPQDLGDNTIGTHRIARIPDTVAARLTRHRLEPGDIVYSRRGDVTKRALVRPEQEGWICGTGCLRARVDPQKADPRFVSYLLGSPAIRDWIQGHAVGATMPNLNTSILSAVPLHVPPHGTQTQIAELLVALDDKIAANHRLATSALTLATTLFEAQPTPTRQDRYDDVALIGGGGTPSTKNEAFWNGTIPWVTPTDVTALTLPYLVGTSRRITDAGLAACSSALYPANSILMTSRATIGAFAIAKVPVAVNQGFIVVRPKDERYFMWLFHEMQNRVAEYLSHANGATFLELSRGRFKDLPVHWPSIESASQFSAHVTPLHDRAVQVSQENTRLETLRDTLLPHLMSGRLSIRQATATVEEVL